METPTVLLDEFNNYVKHVFKDDIHDEQHNEMYRAFCAGATVIMTCQLDKSEAEALRFLNDAEAEIKGRIIGGG